MCREATMLTGHHFYRLEGQFTGCHAVVSVGVGMGYWWPGPCHEKLCVHGLLLRDSTVGPSVVLSRAGGGALCPHQVKLQPFSHSVCVLCVRKRGRHTEAGTALCKHVLKGLLPQALF